MSVILRWTIAFRGLWLKACQHINKLFPFFSKWGVVSLVQLGRMFRFLWRRNTIAEAGLWRPRAELRKWLRGGLLAGSGMWTGNVPQWANSQRTHNAIMTQRKRLHYVNTTSATSCWRSEDVIIASRARWVKINKKTDSKTTLIRQNIFIIIVTLEKCQKISRFTIGHFFNDVMCLRNDDSVWQIAIDML